MSTRRSKTVSAADTYVAMLDAANAQRGRIHGVRAPGERFNNLGSARRFRADPHRFDVVITDQTMPNLTGDALARELLLIRPEVPIVLCTGFSHVISPENAKAMGIRAFLFKPLLMRDLGRTLREVLPQPPIDL